MWIDNIYKSTSSNPFHYRSIPSIDKRAIDQLAPQVSTEYLTSATVTVRIFTACSSLSERDVITASMLRSIYFAVINHRMRMPTGREESMGNLRETGKIVSLMISCHGDVLIY